MLFNFTDPFMLSNKSVSLEQKGGAIDRLYRTKVNRSKPVHLSKSHNVDPGIV
jgi:hypothetical protein